MIGVDSPVRFVETICCQQCMLNSIYINRGQIGDLPKGNFSSSSQNYISKILKSELCMGKQNIHQWRNFMVNNILMNIVIYLFFYMNCYIHTVCYLVSVLGRARSALGKYYYLEIEELQDTIITYAGDLEVSSLSP